MVILRTSVDTLPGVVQHAKHALRGRLNVAPGDVLLISQLVTSLRPGQKPIQYAMEFVACRGDFDGETQRIWGHRWPYLIEGRNMRRLARPFRMRDVQVSDKNYLQGGPLVYVDARDVRAIVAEGLLAPA